MYYCSLRWKLGSKQQTTQERVLGEALCVAFNDTVDDVMLYVGSFIALLVEKTKLIILRTG
jgi:hypothetical protein